MASRASVRLRSLYHRPEEEEQSVASWIQQLKSHRARKFEKTERRFGHFVVSTWQPVDEVPPTLELQSIKNKSVPGRGRGRGGRGGRAGGRGECAFGLRARARASDPHPPLGLQDEAAGEAEDGTRDPPMTLMRRSRPRRRAMSATRRRQSGHASSMTRTRAKRVVTSRAVSPLLARPRLKRESTHPPISPLRVRLSQAHHPRSRPFLLADGGGHSEGDAAVHTALAA